MADRTIEVSGIPFIPNEQLLVDFLKGVVGNGCVRACRLVHSRSHESSTEGDKQVTAIVETESAESAMTLHNLAKAGVLVFWCAALAVKFLPCPEPVRSLPPDLNIHDVLLDPEMCSYEQNNSTEDLLLEPDVSVSKVAPDVHFSEPNKLSDPRVPVPEVVEEQKNSTEDLLLEPDVSVSQVAPDVDFSEPNKLSDPRVPVPEVVEERGPKFSIPEIFGPQFGRRPKKAEQKVACDPEILL